MTNSWFIYQRERFPLVPNLLIAGGIASHGMILIEKAWDAVSLALASAMVLVFFAVLRLMDEVKDVAKDQVAHPERPLARGLISVEKARTVIGWGVFLMMGSAVGVGLLRGLMPGFLYAVTTMYLWLMYKEFYAGPWLGRWPLFYATTHQVVLFPLVASAASLSLEGSKLAFDEGLLWTGGLQIFPAFFAYEVARKIAPGAHPILATYRSVYGLRRCQMMLAGFFFLSLYGFSQAREVYPYDHLTGFVMPTVAAFFAGAPLALSLIKGDAGAKGVEALATLHLLFVLYAPAIIYFFINGRGVSP